MPLTPEAVESGDAMAGVLGANMLITHSWSSSSTAVQSSTSVWPVVGLYLSS